MIPYLLALRRSFRLRIETCPSDRQSFFWAAQRERNVTPEIYTRIQVQKREALIQ